MKSEDDPHLGLWIDACLKFGRYKPSTDDYQRIVNNVEEALRRIAKENALNAMRVSKYGIKLDN